MQRVVRRGVCFWLKQAAEPVKYSTDPLAPGGQPASVPRTSPTSLSGSFSWNPSAHTATFQASLAVAAISAGEESETRGGQAKAARPARGGGRQGTEGFLCKTGRGCPSDEDARGRGLPAHPGCPGAG